MQLTHLFSRGDVPSARPRPTSRGRVLRGALPAGIAAGLAVLSLAAPASAATTSGGSMTVSTTPSFVVEGSPYTSLSFLFTAPSGQGTKGDVALVIPAGWTAPQASAPNSPGFVAVSPGSCSGSTLSSIAGAGPWTVTIAARCNGGRTFSIAFGGGGTQVTAPAAGTYQFTTSVRTQPSGPFVPLATQPVVVVAAATNIRVSLQPITQSVAPGDPVEFAVRIDNDGPVDAQHVQLISILPSATGQVWAIEPPIGCLIAPDQSLQCSMSGLAPGASWSARISGTTSVADCSTSVVLIVGVVTDNERASDGADNSASAQIPVDCSGA
ncbi:MAG TPA: hypothetical protein VK194_07750 [Candidatus Deferrimicrobium sp.]|nr:hypothetical protein [Candidatus Deferrimicrobium sp.]